MQAHHLDRQSLAVLAAIGVSADEVRGSGPFDSDKGAAVFECGDWVGRVAVEVTVFVHHKN